MKTVFIVGILLAIAASPIVTPVTAVHCNGDVTTLSSPDGSVILYLDDRTGGGIGIDHWLYVESNGVTGLQSGGESPLGDADPCKHSNPDTLLF